MTTKTAYTTGQCDAIIPREEGNGPLYNECIKSVKDYGYYEYHTFWDIPSSGDIALYVIAASTLIIAVVLLLKLRFKQQS